MRFSRTLFIPSSWVFCFLLKVKHSFHDLHYKSSIAITSINFDAKHQPCPQISSETPISKLFIMYLVKFARLPIPPLTKDPGNSKDYEPWFEAVKINNYSSDAKQKWKRFCADITASIQNHHRNYQYWNYKICKMELVWKLGTQEAPQVLYEWNQSDPYLQVPEGQHQRIDTALTLHSRAQGDYLYVTYQAGPSRNGQPENASFMQMEEGTG